MYIASELIKRLRKERGWTQQQMAEICDLSLRTIQRVEKDGVGSLETSKSMASAFGLELAEVTEPENAKQSLSERIKSVDPAALVVSFFAGVITTAGVFWLT